MKDLAIIIIDWNGVQDTIECFDSIKNYSLYDIYLLDNGSQEENKNELLNFLSQSQYENLVYRCNVDDFQFSGKTITYVRSDINYGFAKGNNFIACKICSKYRYILLLNNDTVVPFGTIESMVKTAEEKSTVALTCDIRMYYQKDQLWNAGGKLTVLGERRYYSQKKINRLKRNGVNYIDVQFITGCALLICAEYVKSNGLFTDRFFHGEEDFNFCYKLAKQHDRVGVDLSVVIYHKVGKAINSIDNSNSGYGKMLVHYCSRVIDFKFFYSKNKWKAWRLIYLSIVILIRIKSGMPLNKALLLAKKVIVYSNQYDCINKSLFDDMIKSQWKV